MGNISAAADLARELCEDYSTYFDQMMQVRLIPPLNPSPDPIGL
jgi:hypothetical protein